MVSRHPHQTSLVLFADFSSHTRMYPARHLNAVTTIGPYTWPRSLTLSLIPISWCSEMKPWKMREQVIGAKAGHNREWDVCRKHVSCEATSTPFSQLSHMTSPEGLWLARGLLSFCVNLLWVLIVPLLPYQLIVYDRYRSLTHIPALEASMFWTTATFTTWRRFGSLLKTKHTCWTSPCELACSTHFITIECKLIFLPPYSPYLNPIEESFGDLKAFIRRYYCRHCSWFLTYQSFLEWAVREVGTGKGAARRARAHFRNAGIYSTVANWVQF